MKVLFALLAALVMVPALAQSPPKPKPQSVPAKPLDLRLPPQDLPTATASSASAAGVYYGDVSGIPADRPRPQEDYRTHVSGSVGTSIGYAKGLGTDVSNAAELNFSKRFQSGGGVDLHLRVLQDHGFHDHWPDGEAGH